MLAVISEMADVFFYSNLQIYFIVSIKIKKMVYKALEMCYRMERKNLFYM